MDKHLSEITPMFAESEAGQRIAVALAHRVDGIADISRIADAITTMFADINAALTPIIGPKGVAALHRRNLLLCTSTHPQFAEVFKTLVDAMDLRELRSTLIKLQKDEAVFFSEQLLKTFFELLATLIGRSLATRLLLDVWGNSLSGTPPQDTSR
jgi:hypothetical protein